MSRHLTASQVYRFTLPNGLRLWVEPRPESESVTALLVLRVGSRYETPVNNGISHFVEHMVFDGTDKWPTNEDVADVITHRGGRWNGWTSPETTTYFAQLAQRDFEVALDWLSQVVFHPTFPPEKVDPEREVIFQERMGRYGWLINALDALGLGYELERDVRRALFPGSTLGLRVVGEDASLDQLDRAALLGYYHTYYTPTNSVLIIVGNVTPEQAYEKAQTYFGSLPVVTATPAVPETPPLPEGGPQIVTVRGPLATDQTTLLIGMRTVERANPDRWALEVLAEVMGEDLLKDIRFRRGLAYDVHAFNEYFIDAGYFGIATEAASDKRAEIQRTIEQYFEKARRGEITAAQVANAQAALKGRWALAMEDSAGRAAWLAQWALEPGDHPIPDYDAAIDAVTPADLARVVQQYRVAPRQYVGLHQPIVTVSSAALALGGLISVGVAIWVGRKIRKRP